MQKMQTIARWAYFIGTLMVAVTATVCTLSLAWGIYLLWTMIRRAGGWPVWYEAAASVLLVSAATVATSLIWVVALKQKPKLALPASREEET